MIYNCVSCGRELDCSKEGECFSDNPNVFSHPHLGGIRCRKCYAKTHSFCISCDEPLNEEWHYCPWCGEATALNDLQRPVTETLKEQLEKLTVIEDEEIREAKAEAERLYWTHKAHPSYEKNKYLLDRQLNHTKEQLRELLG